jgi:hypothetical protein
LSADARPRFELERPRTLGEILIDALRLLFRHAGATTANEIARNAPVQLVVSGIGLEQLTGPYDSKLSAAELALPTAVSFLVIAPLITATAIHALRAVGAGERPRAGPSLQAGLDVFAPLFLALVLAAAGIALGVVAFILPGIYLAVRWFFVPQTVVLEGARGPEALSASTAVTRDAWWRTFAIVIVANLAVTVPALLITTPASALAEEVDLQAVALAGSILTETLTAPYVALVATLLYFDLKARKALRT